MQKHNYKNKRYQRKAFTFIELLIVIAIIGILFVVLISKVNFATDKAKTTGVQNDFRSFQLAFETVARENAGFSSFVDEDYEQLEMAINKNLDNKLHIDIDDVTGEISMLNGALDPWNTEYHGTYISGDDGKDRGCIAIYSNGANLTFGSKISLTGGIVSIDTTSEDGKDDFVIVSCYSLMNGNGQINVETSGFINNQIIVDNPSDTEHSGIIPDYDNEEDQIVEDNTPKIEPGLYSSSAYHNNDYSTPLKTWEQLLEEEIVYVENGLIYSNYNSETKQNSSSNSLTGTLVFPYNKSITGFAPYAFYGCEKLYYLVIQDNITIIEERAFSHCTGLNKVTMSNKITEVRDYAFYYCWCLNWNELPQNLQTVGEFAFAYNGFAGFNDLILPDGLEYIGNSAFYYCGSIQSIVLPDSLTTMGTAVFYHTNPHTITIGSGLTTLKKYVFKELRSLKTIYMPNTITSIESEVLAGAQALEMIVFDGKIEEWNNVEKANGWYSSNVPDTAIIRCTDGDILLKQ